MKTLTKSEWGFFTLIFIFSAIPVIGGLIRLLELAGGPAIAPENLRALVNPLPISIHILSSGFFCCAGALQFLPNLRRRKPKAHRIIGRAVAITGVLSAVSGLWMTLYFAFPEDLQGNLLFWVRIVLGSIMILSITWAIIAIKMRGIFQHSSAMLRAYAIGQGASTQALLGISWIIVTGTEAAGPEREFIMISAWVLNLLAAEILIWTVLKPTWKRSKQTVG